MWINGETYKLTKHGRRRFRERVTPVLDDAAMIRTAVHGLHGYTFVWKLSLDGTHKRLVTVKFT